MILDIGMAFVKVASVFGVGEVQELFINLEMR